MLVGENDAENGDRDEARFGGQHVRGGKGSDHGGEEDGVLQEVGDQVAAEELDQDDGGRYAEDGADQRGLDESGENGGGGAFGLGEEQGFEDQHGEDGADGVIHDAFPFDDRTDTPFGLDVFQ